ncbi:unnamed protein product [Dovyalis caffra]|uniref:Uncharacterized protein n=1 Tax=Dovyalis caffra TaxID=77055 RepID=A0AAV1R8A7_9ROSI|nr:unnamed protein product [Dovyalis caffra]
MAANAATRARRVAKGDTLACILLPIVGKLRWHKHTEELAWAIRWTNPIMVELAKEARRKSLLDGARAFASEGKHKLHGSLIESLLLVKSLNEGPLIKDRENPTVEIVISLSLRIGPETRAVRRAPPPGFNQPHTDSRAMHRNEDPLLEEHQQEIPPECAVDQGRKPTKLALLSATSQLSPLFEQRMRASR